MIHFVFIWMMMVLLNPSGSAEAHPMGNFSVNHYSGIEVGEREFRIRYILDLAEIPTFQEMQRLDADRDGDITESERQAYLAEKVRSLAMGLMLKVRGEPLALVSDSQEMTLPPGAGGLPTMRLSILYRTESHSLERVRDKTGLADVLYRDDNYPGRAGWKEIAVAGDQGVALIGSSLPTVGGELRAYPEEVLKSPPQILEAKFSFTYGASKGIQFSIPGGIAFVKQGGTQGAPRNDILTSLMTGATTNKSMVLLSLLIAVGLGALHALSPGHGKTLVAAFLVGSRGTARHAFLLGLIVTVSHTIGVFLLGMATLTLSKFFVPERLYPWLGLVSGLAIVIIGLSLFRKQWPSLWKHKAPPGHSPHSHGHDHVHHLDDPPSHHRHSQGSLTGLWALGITGGIIPCPSALVVLLSAIAFHQVGFGLILIVAFSAGLAATLVGIGLLTVYFGGIMNRSGQFESLKQVLPAVSSAAVAMLGLVVAFGAWTAM